VKIAILSCFYPYRGGIAQFNANLYKELGKFHDVKAFNFKRQYPEILFPGKTQYIQEGDPAVEIDSTPVLDTANPFSYITTSRKIRRWEPDLLLMRYWMPWFALSLGYVARNQLKKTKVISVLDNVIPHERRFLDSSFTRYFLGAGDGFIVLSEAVGKDLLSLKPDARYVCVPHPVYDHFGAKGEREEAVERLGLEAGKRNLLFFGLIRDYKGLDILIDAFSMLDDRYQLVIAGEPYGSFEQYQKKIDALTGKNRVKLFTRYIPDSEVPLFFSACDVCVLPYKTATQSGISAISYHYDVPMITTGAGGLRETVELPGTGIVVDAPEPLQVKNAIEKFFDQGMRDTFINNIHKYKTELSWKAFAEKLTDFYHSL